MVTEADARVLDYGSTIVLVAGGHITPLAQDTRGRERRENVPAGSACHDEDGAARHSVRSLRGTARRPATLAS